MSDTSPQIGFCSWSIQPEGPDDIVKIASSTGIPAVQLALMPLIDEPPKWADTVPRLRDSGITILSGMMATIGEDYSSLESIARTGGIRPDQHWAANLDRAKHIADLAAEHAINLVTFHAGFLPEDTDDPERAKLIDRLGTIGEVFAAVNVRLGLETGQETASTLTSILAEDPLRGLGVNFDPANMILYSKGDPVEALRVLADHVVQIHIKDALPSDTIGDWGEEVIAGTGAVDWPAFFDIVKSELRGTHLVIEREAGADRVEDIGAAKRLIETHLESSE